MFLLLVGYKYFAPNGASVGTSLNDQLGFGRTIIGLRPVPCPPRRARSARPLPSRTPDLFFLEGDFALPLGREFFGMKVLDLLKIELGGAVLRVQFQDAAEGGAGASSG